MTAHHSRSDIEDPEQTIRSLQLELAATNHEVLLLNLELEKRVDERTAELRAAKDELQRANTELSKRSAQLERANRELETANRELEAFSYSVSHDLRAPLRAVGGFSQMILDDFGTQLPPESRHLLNVVITNVAHMRTMIDDLLKLSRLGRCSLSLQPVALTPLVRTVLEDLRSSQDLSKVNVEIAELPPCNGDPSLLKQVFINLLSNAIKFSRNKDKPLVHVDSFRKDGETIYFVRDNGAGFDMQFADKLFGVFQRLHNEADFEGTGVGLSIVQRIIHRHGGRIWAEGAPGHGATFYFTLPPLPSH
jgi:light-regulated signal transduction histidine kinase (bacteriophytochrome)